MAKKEPKKEKTREDIREVVLDFPDGSQKPALSFGDAALYLGISAPGFVRVLMKHPEIIRYERGLGLNVYILKEDVKSLNMARPVESKELSVVEDEEE